MLTRIVGIIGWLSCLLVGFSTVVSACVCSEYGTPPCAAYSRADAVFTGTILQVVREQTDPEKSWPMVRIEFSIEARFKNITGKTVQVLASTDTDCSSKYAIGDRLLVYAHKDSEGVLNIWDCDRTTSVASADEDLAYIHQAVKGISKQTISGALRRNGYETMPGVKVTIEQDKKRYAGKTDGEGRFSIDLPATGKYRIRVIFPFAAGALSRMSEVIEEKTTESESIYRYDVSLTKGECDYRELEVYEVDLKATAQITGRVVNEDGTPCPKVMVYLYPATPDQKFTDGGYECKRTDDEGRYAFEGLHEGRFWLGVNLGRMPEMDSPYATTFFPGVPDESTAAVVLLEQGQQLELQDLRVPPKLKEREVTGIMLWPDGKPVTKLSPDAVNGVEPVFSLYDASNPSFSLDTQRLDGSWAKQVSADGHFTFSGFEGYTYVVHAHAWDANNKLMHANVKITVGPENKPLTLILSLPGYGEGEDIKKEISVSKQ